MGPQLKRTSDEKILKIKRLLLSKFFKFESSPWHRQKEYLFVLVDPWKPKLCKSK